uniref:Lipoprotein n=1 Tax=Nitratidesulfovibrio vulgaris (strain DSM 19637 / Miyazaki F) TaxID=883 RepID=B8DNV4_NITV9
MKPLLARALFHSILVTGMLSTAVLPGTAIAREGTPAHAKPGILIAAAATGANGTWDGIPPQQERPRNDTFMGTGGDQSYIGRDPDTGDRVMESKGPPRHQDMPQQQVPMIIAPEINVNGTWGQPQGGNSGNWGSGGKEGGVMRPTPLPPGGIGTGRRQ